MAPRPDPVTSDLVVPERTSIVVVGGGIIGVCAAYFLAEKSIPIVLCDKGQIAAEQSSRNWGWCRKMGRDPLEIPLAVEALRLWAEMDQRVGAETGFRRCGVVYLCRNDRELARREAWLDRVAHPFQLDSQLLTREQLSRVLPGITGIWAGALFTPSDGRAEPQKAAPAIAQAARRLGATILTGCAVRGVETIGGRIATVVTEKGPIACESVVLAGGAWSRLFCRNFGPRLPQLKVMSSVMRTERLEGGPETSASGTGFSLRRRIDGGYTIASWSANVHDIVPDSLRFSSSFFQAWRNQGGTVQLRLGNAFMRELFQSTHWKLDGTSPFERVRILDPPPYEPILRQARINLTAAFPVFHTMRIAESWDGVIDVTPDEIPVISGVDTIPGFYIATGFTGHGFGIGPGAGRLIAQIVTGETPVVDPFPFRYSRFADGAWPRSSPLA